MKVKEEMKVNKESKKKTNKQTNKKTGLQCNVQKIKIMASRLITSWQIDGEKMETVTYFLFLGSKSLQMVAAAMILKDVCCLGEKLLQTQTAY